VIRSGDSKRWSLVAFKYQFGDVTVHFSSRLWTARGEIRAFGPTTVATPLRGRQPSCGHSSRADAFSLSNPNRRGLCYYYREPLP
jgi:hypothetical protein